jgi:SulP family sulfate permease
LSEAIVVGFALGALLFIHRMSQTTGVEEHVPPIVEDKADNANGQRRPYEARLAADPDVVVYRITGAFFFGAAGTVSAVLDRIADRHKALVLDFAAVPFIDTTAANSIEGVVRKAHRHGVVVIVSGAAPVVRKALTTRGIDGPLAEYAINIQKAWTRAQERIGSPVYGEGTMRLVQ